MPLPHIIKFLLKCLTTLILVASLELLRHGFYLGSRSWAAVSFRVALSATFFDLLEIESALSEIETALPEIGTDMPEMETALPEIKTTQPETETALPRIEVLFYEIKTNINLIFGYAYHNEVMI